MKTLYVENIVNNSELIDIPDINNGSGEIEIGLIIEKTTYGFCIIPIDHSEKYFSLANQLQLEVKISESELFGFADDCRKIWQEIIVEAVEQRPKKGGGIENYLCYQDQWDFSNNKILSSRACKLAKAGEQLFFNLFGNQKKYVNPSNEVDEFKNKFKMAIRENELKITVTSDSFFAPWGFLYVHPDTNEDLNYDGSNFKWEGFFGYRHIIQQNNKHHTLIEGLKKNEYSKLKFSANVDTTIDSKKITCIADIVEFLKNNTVLDFIQRNNKSDLANALCSINFSDNIMFFFCHGITSWGTNGPNIESTKIMLTDKEDITPPELELWLEKNGSSILPSHPLVFINACQGGQMKNIFYQGMAVVLLEAEAIAVVGSQVDLPVLFAYEFSKQFFHNLLDTQSTVRVGPLMRALVRDFINKHNNPLGLVYSLYRGADCYVSD